MGREGNEWIGWKAGGWGVMVWELNDMVDDSRAKRIGEILLAFQGLLSSLSFHFVLLCGDDMTCFASIQHSRGTKLSRNNRS